MKNLPNSLLRRIALGLVLSFAMLVSLSSQALAFGTVQLKKTSITEDGGRWKLEMDINYGSKPHMGHIPFDFVLTQTTYFEFSQTDQDKEPVVRKKPLVNQTPQRESVDLDFADSKGDIWPRTRFQVALRRDRGYSAGEYTLVIRRSDDGSQLGSTMRITLDGKNEFIDRRAIVFSSNSKKPAAAASAAPTTTDAAAAAPAAPAASADPDLAEKPPVETPEVQDPTLPTVENRPGAHGCGCQLADTTSSFTALGISILGVSLLISRRRRSA
jgi:LPXTG-motif cell wall-anchored protein